MFDKFHVIAPVSKAVDDTRRQESRQERSARPALKGTPWLWRKNPENLTGKETAEIKELQGKPLATARAYPMRLVLEDISRLPDETSARQKMCEWCRWVKMGGAEIPDPDLRENAQSGSDDREPSGGHSRTTNAFLEGRGGDSGSPP